jgi:hypothetical protein
MLSSRQVFFLNILNGSRQWRSEGRSFDSDGILVEWDPCWVVYPIWDGDVGVSWLKYIPISSLTSSQVRRS